MQHMCIQSASYNVLALFVSCANCDIVLAHFRCGLHAGHASIRRGCCCQEETRPCNLRTCCHSPWSGACKVLPELCCCFMQGLNVSGPDLPSAENQTDFCTLQKELSGSCGKFQEIEIITCAYISVSDGCPSSTTATLHACSICKCARPRDTHKYRRTAKLCASWTLLLGLIGV